MIKAKARATQTLHRKGHKEKCNILEIPTLDFETKEEDIKGNPTVFRVFDCKNQVESIRLFVIASFMKSYSFFFIS